MPTVPEVKGSSESEAKTKLEAAGLVVGTVTQAASDDIPPGNATRTHPPADSNVEAGSTVDLEVSSGPATADLDVSSEVAAVTVPPVTGLTEAQAQKRLEGEGLKFSTVTAASATVPAGNVSGTTPAAGTLVDPGSTVSIEVSSGPPQLTVPPLIGLTQTAAEEALKAAGLILGKVTKVASDSVSGVYPPVGTPVNAGSPVELQVSRPTWLQQLSTLIFPGFGLALILALAVGLAVGGLDFIDKLADIDVARGLITFLIAAATVGIAIVLAISTIVSQGGSDGERRFDNGKQILTILIGVLGTIVGFYFASTTNEQRAADEAVLAGAQTAPALPDGSVGSAYELPAIPTAGLLEPVTWTVEPALPAGLELNAETGAVGGTPTAASAQAQYTFTATDSAEPPQSASVNRTLEIK